MGAVQARPRPGPLPAVRATPRPVRPPRAPAAAARRRLLVVAPAWGAAVAGALDGPGVRAAYRERPAADGGADPYGIGALLAEAGARPDAVLLVAPRTRALARLLPGPVVQGVPVGIVQADGAAELGPWLAAVAPAPDPEPAWAVLAMAKDAYLGLARRFRDRLRAGADDRVRVPDWMADRYTAAEAAAALAGGPRLAVYLGHGRPNGWSGYQGFRWTHVAAAPPVRACGTVIGFSCRNLKHVRGALPFGTRWVTEGRAAAFLGAVSDVGTEAGFTLADELARELAEGGHESIGQVLAALDRRLAVDPSLAPAHRELRRFRLIGNPLQPLL
jgi:hypothetical protein